MLKDIKNSIIICLVIVIGILLLLQQCNNKPRPLIKQIDTVTTWDTIDRPYEVIKFKPQYFPKYDTITKISYQVDSNLCKYERTYTDSFPDSNVTIFTDIKTIGVLKLNKVSYRLKVPQTIIQTNNITTTVAVPNKWDVYLNTTVGGNIDQFDFGVGGALRVKKTYIGYNYFLIGKTHNVTVGARILKSKK